MEFESIVALARDTPNSELCKAWGTTKTEVISCKQGERPMTMREVGALAELHGMKLPDIFAI